MKRRSFITGVSAVTALSTMNSCMKRNSVATVIPEGTIPKVAFGKTGMQVSRFGFGSHLKKELVEKPAVRDAMIKTAFEHGVNVFDVYDHMDCKQFQPMSDSIRGFRKEVLISLVSIKTTPETPQEVDDALKVFRTDYIDLFRLYTVDDERMKIMEKCKKEGKIRAIGVVEHSVDKLTEFLDRYGESIDYVMVIYNFHHNKAILFKEHQSDSFENNYATLMPRIRNMNLGVMGMKPMGSDAMVELADKHGYFKRKDVNVAQAMLKYVYESKDIHTTIPAMNSMKELTTNMAAIFNPSLSAAEKKVLGELSALASSTKSAYLPPHYKFLEQWAAQTETV